MKHALFTLVLLAGSAQAQPGGGACLTPLQVRNMETSASSIALKPIDKQVMQADIDRAKACQPLMTDSEKTAMRQSLADGVRARRASRPAVLTNCDAAGCWDTNGKRYTRSAGGFTRDDGAACRTVGNQLNCD